MFKIFKPYMLLLFILLASSSIAMAQDCDGCPLGTICDNRGECVPDVDLDRDLDGVPDAVDNCPDEGNPPQKTHTCLRHCVILCESHGGRKIICNSPLGG